MNPGHRKAPATLRQVALEANVSMATISRYLNGHLKVTPETEGRILAAIKKLDYRANFLAKSLAQGQTKMLGVYTPRVSSPFYNQIRLGVELEVGQSDYVCLSISGEYQHRQEEEVLRMVIERQVDGIFVFGSDIADERLLELSGHLPMAVFGHRIQAPRACSICIDNMPAAAAAVRYLIGEGHRDIAFIGPRNPRNDLLERLEGYKSALQEAGLPFRQELLVQGEFTEPGGGAAIEVLAARGVRYTAVFCTNDQMAYGANLELHRRGLKVPDDVSLVGFDDLYTSAYINPPLTTVLQPAHDVGRELGRAMLKMLAGEAPELHTPDLRLIVRQSTRSLR